MNFKEFKELVIDCKGLVTQWSQDKFVDGKAYLDEGACLELSLIWIRNEIFRSKNLKKPKDTLKQALEMKKPRKLGRGDLGMKAFLKNNNLKEKEVIFFKKDFDLVKAITLITKKRGFYSVNGTSDNDGHSIAISTNSSKPSLFDPNYGTATFPSDIDLELFFEFYWEDAYPKFDGACYVEEYFYDKKL